MLNQFVVIIGESFKASRTLYIAVGIAVIVFGLLPGVNFYTRLPTLHGVVKKPASRRLWFVAGGALLIYWGPSHAR